MDIVNDPDGKTWRQRLNIEAEEVYKQGIIDANEAEHQKDSVQHLTINHDPFHQGDIPALSQ